MKNAVREIFNKDIQEGRAKFIAKSFSISEFVNPLIDGEHDDIFCFWKVKQYPSKIFLYQILLMEDKHYAMFFI